jgi:hypothetical protein
MQLAMSVNVQSAGTQPWVDLSRVVPPPTLPAPAITETKAERHAAETRVHAVVPISHYERAIDTMRLRAFRRDAAETASLVTQTPAETATASTTSAPAVKGAPVQVNPAAVPAQVTAPLRMPPPDVPDVHAPEAVDAHNSSSPRR